MSGCVPTQRLAAYERGPKLAWLDGCMAGQSRRGPMQGWHHHAHPGRICAAVCAVRVGKPLTAHGDKSAPQNWRTLAGRPQTVTGCTTTPPSTGRRSWAKARPGRSSGTRWSATGLSCSTAATRARESRVAIRRSWPTRGRAAAKSCAQATAAAWTLPSSPDDDVSARQVQQPPGSEAETD